MRIHRHLPALLGVLAALGSGCACYQAPAPDKHVVPAPISVRANVVLHSVIELYASPDGDWRGCLSPGCALIWGTQFGYRAGTRRHRKDLIRLGDQSASFQSSLVKGLAWSEIFGGEYEFRREAMSGFPALLLSATFGHDPIDGFLFSEGLDRLGGGSAGSLTERESAGAAAMLAAAAAAKPTRREEYLERARGLAAAAAEGGHGTWGALAQAAIARVSGESADVDRAREAILACGYRMDPETGEMADPPVDGIQVLSRNLAMIHALAELAAVTWDPKLHRAATSLLDQTFADTWFDGRFLRHDTQRLMADHHCSGCQLWALYLVDCIYGDTFVIGDLPAVADRGPRVELPWYEQLPYLVQLSAGTGGEPGHSRMSEHPLTLLGAWGFEHEAEPVRLYVKYAIIVDWAFPPNGGLELEIVSERSGERSEIRMSVGFDESGVARTKLGAAPLIVELTVTRLGEGEETTYRADFGLREE